MSPSPKPIIRILISGNSIPHIMTTLSQAKALGGVGSILLLLGTIPSAGTLFSIVGFILVLVAVKYIANVVQDRAIYNNMIISVIMGIIGMIVFFVLVVGALAAFIGLPPPPGFFEPPAEVEDIGADVLAFIAALLVGLAILWIFFIISAVFLRKSFNAIAGRLNVRMFSTAATLYLIGAFLLVILVGFVLIFVAQILMAVAFFSIREPAPQPVQMAPPAGTPP
jgi:uncharacterized membrane protein